MTQKPQDEWAREIANKIVPPLVRVPSAPVLRDRIVAALVAVKENAK